MIAQTVGYDPYQRFSDDPTRNKHHGNRESRMAWERAKYTVVESQQAILNALEAVEPEGLTGKECARILAKGFNAVSGRITELLEMGLVYDTKERRDGCRIVKLSAPGSSFLSNPQPAVVDKAALKAEIARLSDAGDHWGALRVAREHNISIRLELPGVHV